MTRCRSTSLAILTTCLLFAVTATRVDATTYNDLATFQAATASLTYIDFDTDTFGDPTVHLAQVGATYTSLGIDFPVGNYFVGGAGGPVSPPNVWLNDTSDGPDRVFDATFNVGGITAVGVHNIFNSGTPDGTLLRAFDGSNVLLESVLSDNDGNTLDFIGLTTTSPIARITVTVLNASGWGLDDLYFGPTQVAVDPIAVPEPSTLALLGLGLVGWAAKRRRLTVA